MVDVITMPESLYVFGSARFNLVTVNTSTDPNAFAPMARVGGPSVAFWRAELNFRPREGRTDIDELMGFVLRLKGGRVLARIHDPFRVARAGETQPRGAGGTGPVVNVAADAAAGAETITLGGLVASQASSLMLMDQLGIGENLHAVIGPGPSDGDGEGTFSIWPPLRKGVAEGDPVTLVAPTARFRLIKGGEDLTQFGRGHTYAEAVSLSFVEEPDIDA
jgi:hypothetical protein